MSDKVYNVPAEWASRAFVNNEKYLAMYKRSVEDPDGFWGEIGKRIDWIKPYTKVKNTSYAPDNVSIKWYEDGTLNVSANCIDRHLKTRADQVAIIWEGDDPTHDEKITYRQLHERVCKFANVLKANGVKKGDRVTIYLPMIPEAAYAMLACARIGAVHSVVFGGFSPDSLAGPHRRCRLQVHHHGRRGRARRPADPAQEEHRRGAQEAARATRRCWWCAAPARRCPGPPVATSGCTRSWSRSTPTARPSEMSAEDPLFILYTSGSTGKPKGVLHTSGGYLVYASMTHQYVFDYHDGDIYWCTADVGWVTGHSYILYGPLSNGATTLMFEGVPNYPTASRFWHVIDKWDVNTFYTAPTAIRALMGAGDDFVKRTDRSSLRLLGIGRRADQSGGVGVVSPRGRRRPLPDRRHLVADRDRRHPHHAAARRHQAQARLGDAAVLRHQAGAGRREGQRPRGRGQRQPRHPRQLAGADAHASTATTSASCRPTSPPTRACTSPATAAGATRTATTGSPAASTT